ncbi:MAG: phosphonate C-P lyase system protein PhnH [Pseudomonadota bacterium]
MVALAPGFADPGFDAQKVFRIVMNAMAGPGMPRSVPVALRPPPPLNPVAAALALTLADYETPLWLDPMLAHNEAVVEWLRVHCGAPITTNTNEARFALIADPDKLPALGHFALGSQDYPDRSATLIIQVKMFDRKAGPLLSGPGIETARRCHPVPLPETIWTLVADNADLYPRGVDLVFATEKALAALPRSTRVDMEEPACM